MKILKKFENYIKEELDINPEADEISPEDLEAASDKYDEIAEIEEESDDMLEEEDEYIGYKLLEELAKKLGTEVVDNQVEYNGEKNWFVAYRYGTVMLKQVGMMAMIGLKDFSNVEKLNVFGAGNDWLIIAENNDPMFDKLKHLIEEEA